MLFSSIMRRTLPWTTSGRELILAHYIHDHSKRQGKPMITVNCAAFPENLVEAELFGYEKGSFTGASRDGKIGLAEAAHSPANGIV